MSYVIGLVLFVLSQVLIHTDVVDLPRVVDNLVSTNTLGWICFAIGALVVIVAVARTDTSDYDDDYSKYHQ